MTKARQAHASREASTTRGRMRRSDVGRLAAMWGAIRTVFANKNSPRFCLVLSLILTCASRITFWRDGGIPSIFRRERWNRRGRAVRSMGKRKASGYKASDDRSQLISKMPRDDAAGQFPIQTASSHTVPSPFVSNSSPALIFPRALCPEALPNAAAQPHA